MTITRQHERRAYMTLTAEQVEGSPAATCFPRTERRSARRAALAHALTPLFGPDALAAYSILREIFTTSEPPVGWVKMLEPLTRLR